MESAEIQQVQDTPFVLPEDAAPENAKAGIEKQELYNKDPFTFNFALQGVDAADSTKYGVIFIAPYKLEIIAIGLYAMAPTSANTTLLLEKLTGNQNTTEGVSVLAANFRLDGSTSPGSIWTRVVVYPALTATTANRKLDKNDKLCWNVSSSLLTNLNNMNIIIIFRPVAQGHYRNV